MKSTVLNYGIYTRVRRAVLFHWGLIHWGLYLDVESSVGPHGLLFRLKEQCCYRAYNKIKRAILATELDSTKRAVLFHRVKHTGEKSSVVPQGVMLMQTAGTKQRWNNHCCSTRANLR